MLEIRALGGQVVAVTERLDRSFDRYFADIMSVGDLIFALATGRQ
ncbi:MAG TPA: hypothetical protein VGO70_00695 [Arsenicitalea sp.]|nr:hypothetical protein [Arsenicitalea sp.]